MQSRPDPVGGNRMGAGVVCGVVAATHDNNGLVPVLGAAVVDKDAGNRRR